jgi:hypothetical protein
MFAGAALGAVTAVLTAAAIATPASATASAAPVPRLSGGAVYAGTGQVSRFHDGSWSTLATTGDIPQYAAAPDGKKVAWVTAQGRLQVRNGTRTTTVATGLQGGTPCLTPVWSSDSARVAYPAKGDVIMAVDAGGGGARRLGTSKGVCHLAWSAGGRYLAGYTGEADAVYRLDVKTGRAARAKGVKWVTHVQSVSPNGRDAVVGFPASPDMLGDGSWPTSFTPVVLDMVTGGRRPVAVKGRLLGAVYMSDGRLVVRVAGAAHNTLVALDRTGRPIQTIAEPAKAKNLALLQVLR